MNLFDIVSPYPSTFTKDDVEYYAQICPKCRHILEAIPLKDFIKNYKDTSFTNTNCPKCSVRFENPCGYIN